MWLALANEMCAELACAYLKWKKKSQWAILYSFLPLSTNNWQCSGWCQFQQGGLSTKQQSRVPSSHMTNIFVVSEGNKTWCYKTVRFGACMLTNHSQACLTNSVFHHDKDLLRTSERTTEGWGMFYSFTSTQSHLVWSWTAKSISFGFCYPQEVFSTTFPMSPGWSLLKWLQVQTGDLKE
jgi:hypothetical protein